MTESILQDSTRRFNLFPIKYPELFQRYKTLQSSFWVPEEVDLENDIEEFQKLDKKEKTFLSYVLAFFRVRRLYRQPEHFEFSKRDYVA